MFRFLLSVKGEEGCAYRTTKARMVAEVLGRCAEWQGVWDQTARRARPRRIVQHNVQLTVGDTFTVPPHAAHGA